MKKFLYIMSIFALLAMTLGFNACQQKNQPETPQEEGPTLVGDWAATSVSQYQKDGPSEVLVGTATFSDDTFKYLSLEANGTGLLKIENDLVSFSWKKVSNQLMLYQGSELFITYEITSLTKNTLVLSEYDSSRTSRTETTYAKR